MSGRTPPLPNLFHAHPETRAIFNRYGLRGCGGEHGPSESIAFFAGTHGVALEDLLRDVQRVIDDPTARRRAQLDEDQQPRLSDAIYRPFFLAGLVVILTVSTAWGAMILWRIGMQGSYTSIGALEVNAHGHAQIMGWVGLFIMGFRGRSARHATPILHRGTHEAGAEGRSDAAADHGGHLGRRRNAGRGSVCALDHRAERDHPHRGGRRFEFVSPVPHIKKAPLHYDPPNPRRVSDMSDPKALVYDYQCDQCRHRFEVVTMFREREPFDRDEDGRLHPAGYPEQQPECPTCHSHKVVRVDVRENE